MPHMHSNFLTLVQRTHDTAPGVCPHMTRKELSIRDMAKLLGVGRTKLYALIAAGKVEPPRVVPVRRVWDAETAERIRARLCH